MRETSRMRDTSRSGLIKSLFLALALVGAVLFGAPKGAQAAPAIVSAEVAGPSTGLTEVQYGGYGRHYRSRRFHHHHHRGRHFGHHHRRHFGHHHGHRHGHHYGPRRFRY